MPKIDENRAVVGLEVGSSRVVCIIGQVFPDNTVEVLGVGTCPSRNVSRGAINNFKHAVQSIRTALDQAKAITGVDVYRTTLAVTGSNIKSFNETGEVTIKHSTISEKDKIDALQVAQNVVITDGSSILHAIPQEYSRDNGKGYITGRENYIKEPVNLVAHKLKVRAHIITINELFLQDLINAVHSAGLNVDEKVYAGCAAGEAVLSEDEKDRGVCLIDIGGGTIDILVYTEGAIRCSYILETGGIYVTKVISDILSVPFKIAENLKLTYGSAYLSSIIDPHDNIEIEQTNGSKLNISKAKFAEITSKTIRQQLLQARDKLEEFRTQLKADGFDSYITGGIVITGGGANMPGIQECVREIFNMNARIGVPINVTGQVQPVNAPEYATAVGTLNMMYSGPVEYMTNVDSENMVKPVTEEQPHKKGGFSKFFHRAKNAMLDD